MERIVTLLLMGKPLLPFYRKYCFKISLSFPNTFLSVLLKLILFIDVKISLHFYKKQKGISIQQLLKQVTLISLTSLGEVDSILACLHLIPFLFTEGVS